MKDKSPQRSTSPRGVTVNNFDEPHRHVSRKRDGLRNNSLCGLLEFCSSVRKYRHKGSLRRTVGRSSYGCRSRFRGSMSFSETGHKRRYIDK